jgi:hypothetical protein
MITAKEANKISTEKHLEFLNGESIMELNVLNELIIEVTERGEFRVFTDKNINAITLKELEKLGYDVSVDPDGDVIITW